MSSEILKEFLHDCHVTLEKQIRGKTSIYVNGDGWTLAMRRSQRRMDTIVLPEKVKTEFLNDIEEYLDPDARAWYADRDLPYRRGYLLHGKPGTGKSSLSFAAAGKFNLDIYVLNLAKVNDASLQKLLGKLPTRCIVLLEDIDAIDTAKNRVGNAASQNEEPTGNSVTLSGLLNALDGVASEEGRVLIMTTNHVDRVDNALIRPGRVDKMVEFGLANRDILHGLFRFIFMPLKPEAPKIKAASTSHNTDAIEELAAIFAGRVPEMRFSPAEVLSFLIEHKKSPREAVEKVKSWVNCGGEGSVPLRSQKPAMCGVGDSEMQFKEINLDDLVHWESFTP
ncbi:hypothetical protein K4F52_004832 [Lecanicillium sp. MT-2017a]|nr:hypothetical protein K4F52_004832 [Lecanicillium sp. MT-2017a]